MIKIALTLLFAITMTSGCRADEIKVGFGDHIPPYAIPESASGIEVQLLREALAYRGHTIRPLFYPIRRLPVAFKNREIDITLRDAGTDLRPYGGLYSVPAIVYDNVLITLTSRHIAIHTPDDLKGLRVIAFPGALARFPDWLEGVKQSGLYTEETNQELQVATLQAGHYDVVLSDRRIFHYFQSKLRAQSQNLDPVDEQFFAVTSDTTYRAIFRDAKLKEDFEAGLKHLKETGRYSKIIDGYIH
jgi:polar amino acid transport system substrate-binding protein